MPLAILPLSSSSKLTAACFLCCGCSFFSDSFASGFFWTEGCFTTSLFSALFSSCISLSRRFFPAASFLCDTLCSFFCSVFLSGLLFSVFGSASISRSIRSAFFSPLIPAKLRSFASAFNAATDISSYFMTYPHFTSYYVTFTWKLPADMPVRKIYNAPIVSSNPILFKLTDLITVQQNGKRTII